ncbi:MAG TPA: ATP-binding protein [Ktedonobacterales bacterium]|nr:ATP-binding protein [Ktedonobacterales bacterium]
MDVVQFGRWLGERRRACGWTSQRSLMESALEHPHTRDLGISEAFLARLEAGLLAYPFRGAVRKRVLALVWLLCKSARQTREYLRLAGLTDLSVEEQEMMRTVLASFSDVASAAPPLLLPARPPRLLGRAGALNELLRTLRTVETGLCVVTGMPGVGKSALAAEALHLIAADERARHELFPDGIVSFSGAGRRGTGGLLALLDELCAVFTAESSSARASTRHSEKPTSSGERLARPDVAGTLNRTRSVVAGKRFLLLLDDMDARFPLRDALDAVLATGHAAGANGPAEAERRVVLVTSRYAPEAALIRIRQDVAPLDADAALALFTSLLQRDLAPGEILQARAICMEVGNLPLAIELAATAALSEGIPLPLLAARLSSHALDISADSRRELRLRLERELDAVDAEARELFALLALLGTPAFTLEAAAALRDARWPESIATEEVIPELAALAPDDQANTATAEDRLARTAALLGQLVRHSLLRIEGDHIGASSYDDDGDGDGDGNDDGDGPGPGSGVGVRYHLQPLVYACARERMEQLDSAVRERALHNAQHFALSYLCKHEEDPLALARQRDFLLAMVARAARGGQHAQVQRFVFGLTASQHNLLALRERSANLFTLAIRSSRLLHDPMSEARLLNRLGLLYYYSGSIAQARTAWEASANLCAELAARGVACGGLAWYPLYNLAQMTWELDELETAQHYAELSLRHAREHYPTMVLPSLLTRAMVARARGDLAAARADLESCRALKTAPMEVGPVATLIAGLRPCIEAEIARVEGVYRHSVMATEKSVSYFQAEDDLLSAANVLLEQARYAEVHEYRADARLFASRAVALGRKAHAEFVQARGKELLLRLNNSATFSRPG